MSLAPRSFDRTGSVLTLKRDSLGGLILAEEPAAGPRRASVSEGPAEPAGVQSPLLGSEHDDADSQPDKGDNFDSRIQFAMNASLVANVLLLLAKAYAFYWSKSKAVLASAADSFVDIASQV